MADKHAEIMHPRGRIQHIVIERPALRELPGKLIQARLMAELVRRTSVRAHVIGDGLSVTVGIHGVQMVVGLLPSVKVGAGSNGGANS